MYIKSVVLDGFKSYGSRVEVGPFDKQFNAITGLNGTGKSNILDSICFVLGIQTLQHVRVHNLQELVYKNGHAGITKATVTITFDNRDKSQCPIGCEQYDELVISRQVAIGGRNKYLLNGLNVNAKRITDLFRSVQLNVNNPHFLIMQGRVTKVLNMKPPEILSMIEEAAGTKMYDTKKGDAEKRIEKKAEKLREIDVTLKETIVPRIQRLKDEQAGYIEYQRVVREHTQFEKLWVAWKYVRHQKEIATCAAKVQETKDSEVQLNTRLTEIGECKAAKEAEATELRSAGDGGAAVGQLDAEVKRKREAVAQVEAELSAAKDAVEDERRRGRQLEQQRVKEGEALERRRGEQTKLEESVAALFSAHEAAKQAYEKAGKRLEALRLGVSSGDTQEEGTAKEQLMAASRELSSAQSELAKLTESRSAWEKQLKSSRAELKNTACESGAAVKRLEKGEQELQLLEAELSRLGVSESAGAQLRQLEQEVASALRLQEQFERSNPRTQLHFRANGFDARDVYGRVLKLFRIKDPRFATALEVVAGGKLYQVVVKNPDVGKALIQRGELQQRETLIPLSSVRPNVIPNRTVSDATRLVGSDKCWPALSLIEYPPEMQRAMEFVFGGTFVCSDMNVAKRVTFELGDKRASVTLDGDQFNPGGSLTGGSRSRGNAILARVSELNQQLEGLAGKEAQLAQLQDAVERGSGLQSRRDLLRHDVELTRQGISSTDHARIQAVVAELEGNIANAAESRSVQQTSVAQLEVQVKDLKYRVENADSLREGEKKEAEKILKEAKAAFTKLEKEFSQKKSSVDSVRAEVAEMEKEKSSDDGETTEIGRRIEEMLQQITQIEERLAVAAAELETARVALAVARGEQETQQREVEKRLKAVKELDKESNAAELQLLELKHELETRVELLEEGREHVRKILRDQAWVAAEAEHFGVPGSDYDFAKHNRSHLESKLAKLREQKDKLEKTVDVRAANLFGGSGEAEYKALVEKRQIVLADMDKLTELMRELDLKKNETLKEVYNKVSVDFGSIFSTLLPGAQAMLVSIMSGEILTGIQFKVGFGDSWKEQLSELSGGQRSLVALSLILALLNYKPAPLYILDEVDAALDLSHTQNIGKMIKEHFKHSQFVIVSLKDGMFNNANVLFKTQFQDGVSGVTRQLSKALEAEKRADGEPAASKKSRRAH